MLSRVADSIYWMSRYLERAEHTARLIAVKLESMVEQSQDDATASWSRVVAALAGEPVAHTSADALLLTETLAFDRYNPSSLASSLRFARDNARQVREELSTEVWENLNRLYLRLQKVTIGDVWVHQPARFFREILDALYLLGGLSHTTLRHDEGWHFLELGRFIERAQLVSRLLDIHFGLATPGYAVMPPQPRYTDWIVLLKFCTAFEPYCKKHTAAMVPARIAEFLLFDEKFPHSVRFAVDRVSAALSRVAPDATPVRRAACERLAGRLKAVIDYGRIEDMNAGSIDEFLLDVVHQCEQIHEAIYSAYIGYDAEAVL